LTLTANVNAAIEFWFESQSKQL